MNIILETKIIALIVYAIIFHFPFSYAHLRSPSPKVFLHQAVKQTLCFVKGLPDDRFGFVDLF